MMKPTALAVLSVLTFSLLAIPGAFAQYSRHSYGPEQSFVVGVAPLSLMLRSGKFNVRGEWAYADNKSLSVIVGIPRRSKVPGWFLNDIEVDENGKTTTNDFHSLGVTIENRFYLGSEALRGFYLAPYARYNRIWLTHTSENPEQQGDIRITGAVGGAGLGAAAGWQFRLGERMRLDLTFLGIDFKWLRGTLTYANSNPNNDIEAFRAKVEEAVKDIPLIGKKLTPEIENNEIKVRTPGWVLPAYRFNLTVGYAF